MSDPSARTAPPVRAQFPAFRAIATRWMDNDHYGHVNNVAYYSYFDTAVNGWLIETCGVDIRTLPAIGLVVETGCRYFRPLSFPDSLEVGLAIERLGASSIAYRLAIFRHGDDEAAAAGRFVHVYVDAKSRRPTEVPAAIRSAANALLLARSP
ncbi:MAG: acyl-CoA thioesterase [Steroidobacteraceae bacterium]